MNSYPNSEPQPPSPSDHRWSSCNANAAPQGKVLWTKIHDGKGCRNIQQLKRRNSLWFFPDDSMYVYYVPTHWMEV